MDGGASADADGLKRRACVAWPVPQSRYLCKTPRPKRVSSAFEQLGKRYFLFNKIHEKVELCRCMALPSESMALRLSAETVASPLYMKERARSVTVVNTHVSLIRFESVTMTKCEHSFWLELSHEMAAPQVVYGSRLARFVNELPQPSVQLPQVVFFMGHHQKNKALRQLCSSNYRGQGRNASSVNIRSDNRTLQSLQPRFFADCDPCRSLLSTHESLRNCHEEKIYPVELPSTEYSLQDIIIARLVFLFTDVVCIFADDVGGFEGTRKLLTTWAAIGSASSLPPAVRPRVIVVVSQSPSITGSVIDENDFLFELLHAGDVPYFSAFRDIQVSSLPAEELSSDARYMTLCSDVSRQLRSSRVDRERYRSLFSAIHLSAFFELALHNFSASPFAPFDFIRSARDRNPLDGAFASHITSFLKVGSKTRTPYNEMASHIASAILMDAYPPGMHCKWPPLWLLVCLTSLDFLPSMVYRTLYHDPCYTGLRKFYSTDALASVQSERVQHHLSRFFEHMASNLGPSSEIHKNNLRQQRKFWAWAKSNKTCLLCLRRYPEHPQACGHGICDTCAEIFGEPSLHTEHEYTICQCILCGNAKGLTVRLKPPTAAPRLLSIDGGGLRGIIPPSNLELLQKDIGPELPLADLIDLRVGTSSGGLYVIAMDILRMGPSEFKRVFQGLAKKVLGPDQRKGRIMSLLSDATYDTKALENQYKDVLDQRGGCLMRQRLFYLPERWRSRQLLSKMGRCSFSRTIMGQHPTVRNPVLISLCVPE